METRIALIGIIVENPDSVEQLNHLLHEYGSFIVGRMGIPYEKKNVNIISVAIVRQDWQAGWHRSEDSLL